MLIYLVEGDYYEQRYVAAAFTSKQAAEDYVERRNKEEGMPPYYYSFAGEIEVDEKVTV